MTGTVLFVDDEELILESIDGLFLDHDIRILTAANAADALNIFEREEISVIVSDYSMPGMKGIELLSKVKERSPDTLKILMTAHADLSIAVDAINNGEVFRFLIKPWQAEHLIGTVHEAVKRYQIVQSLKNIDESTFLSLAQTIELKDPYTRGHCERVAHYALIIADKLGLPPETKDKIKFGSWLHDCGKIGVPEKILNKEGSLTETEFDVIKKHPSWGADVAKQANLPKMIHNIILYHHERHDGTGYPTGIRGKEIPLEARIVAVADVYDALTSARSYRGQYSTDKAIKIMIAMRENVFDPEIIDIFIEKCLSISKDNLSLILNESII